MKGLTVFLQSCRLDASSINQKEWLIPSMEVHQQRKNIAAKPNFLKSTFYVRKWYYLFASVFAIITIFVNNCSNANPVGISWMKNLLYCIIFLLRKLLTTRTPKLSLANNINHLGLPKQVIKLSNYIPSCFDILFLVIQRNIHQVQMTWFLITY